VLYPEHSLAVSPELPVLWFYFFLLYTGPFLGGTVFNFGGGLERATVGGGGGHRLLPFSVL